MRKKRRQQDTRQKAQEEDGFAFSLDDLRPLFEDANIAKIGYNVKPHRNHFGAGGR